METSSLLLVMYTNEHSVIAEKYHCEMALFFSSKSHHKNKERSISASDFRVL